MCEINPKHNQVFVIEVFTTADISREVFDKSVAETLFNLEVNLNKGGWLRFHIHSKEERDRLEDRVRILEEWMGMVEEADRNRIASGRESIFE